MYQKESIRVLRECKSIRLYESHEKRYKEEYQENKSIRVRVHEYKSWGIAYKSRKVKSI